MPQEKQIAINIKAAVKGIEELRQLTDALNNLQKAFGAVRAESKNISTSLASGFQAAQKEAEAFSVSLLRNFSSVERAGVAAGRSLRNSFASLPTGIVDQFAGVVGQLRRARAEAQISREAFSRAPDARAGALDRDLAIKILRTDPFQRVRDQFTLGETADQIERSFKSLTGSVVDLRKVLISAGFTMFQFGRTSAIAGASVLSLSAGLSGVVGVLAGAALGTALASLAAGFTLLKSAIEGALGALIAFVRDGLKANEEVRLQSITLASLIATNYDLIDAQGRTLEGQEKFNAALNVSHSLYGRVLERAAETVATSQDILNILTQALSTRATDNLDKLIDVAQGLAQLAPLFDTPAALNEEIRNLLAGTATAQTRLATLLFGSPSQANQLIKQAKQEGKDVADIILKALEQVRLSGPLLAQTATVALSNIKDKIRLLSIGITNELFKLVSGLLTRIDQGLQKLLDRLRVGEVPRPVVALAAFVSTISDGFKSLVDVASRLFERLSAAFDDRVITAYVAYLRELVALIKEIIASALTIGGLLLGIVRSIVGARDNSELLVRFYRVLTSLLNIARNLVESFAAQIGVALSLINSIVEATGNFVSRLAQAVPFVSQLTTLFRYIGAVLTGGEKGALTQIEQTKNDLNDFFQRLLGGVSTNFSVRARPTAVEKKAASGGAKDTDDSLRRRLQRVESDLDLIRERLQAEVNIFKSDADRVVDELETRYARSLISLREYFDARRRIIEEQNAREQNRLITEQALNRERLRARFAALGLGLDAGIARAEQIRRLPRNAPISKEDLEVLKTYNDYLAEQAKLTASIIELDNRRQSELERLAQDRERELLDFQRNVRDVFAQLDEEIGNSAAAFLSNFEQRFEDFIKRLKIEANAGVAEAQSALDALDKLRERGFQKARAGDIRREIDSLFSSLETFEQRLQFDLQQRGATELQIEQIISAVRQGRVEALRNESKELQDQARIYALTVDKIREHIQALRAIGEQLGDLDLITRAEELRLQLDQTLVVVNTLGQSINQTIIGALGSAFDALLTDVSDLGTNLRRVFGQMFIDLAKIIFQATVLQSILNALGLGSGAAQRGTGGIGGFFARILGIGAGTVPKMATGGVVRGAGTSVSDSIPALLSHGEAVIPASVVRAWGGDFFESLIRGRLRPVRLADGGIIGDVAVKPAAGTVSQSLRVVNVLDPNLLESYMQTSSGERVVLNIIARNGHAIRQLLRA